MIQGLMPKTGYSDPQEPGASGSTAPVAEALGTDRPAGRTGQAGSSHTPSPTPAHASVLPGAVDASNHHFRLTYYDPPAPLQRHILTLFHFEWDDEAIADRHPGGLGQLFVTLCGEGEIRFGDETRQVSPGPFMFSGFDRAAPFSMRGPWHSIGASLSPLGWAALAQAPATEGLNRFVPAGELLGKQADEFAGPFIERYHDGQLEGEECCALLAEWIAARLVDIPEEHRRLIEKVLAWLASSIHPEVDTLYVHFDYSRRQVERLVTRYFGLTPAALARKMRAIRAANLLSQRDLSDENEAEIAAAFYDQPHMIREIRRYCGYTPTRLGGSGEPLFQAMLRMRNLDRLEQFRRIGLDIPEG